MSSHTAPAALTTSIIIFPRVRTAITTAGITRRDYLPEEFQYILKLGVLPRTQIERGTAVGNNVASAFAGHEARRMKRRI
jgi:hypothetical protein